jgi:hypothetical protein
MLPRQTAPDIFVPACTIKYPYQRITLLAADAEPVYCTHQ